MEIADPAISKSIFAIESKLLNTTFQRFLSPTRCPKWNSTWIEQFAPPKKDVEARGFLTAARWRDWLLDLHGGAQFSRGFRRAGVRAAGEYPPPSRKSAPGQESDQESDRHSRTRLVLSLSHRRDTFVRLTSIHQLGIFLLETQKQLRSTLMFFRYYFLGLLLLVDSELRFFFRRVVRRCLKIFRCFWLLNV